MESLYQIAGLTAGLGIANILIVRWIGGIWAAPSLFYWLGWTIVPLVYEQAIAYDALPGPMPVTFEILVASHVGAFLGFAGASILGRFLRSPRAVERSEAVLRARLDSRRFDEVLRWMSWLVLLQGVLMLGYRIAVVGHVDVSFLSEARESFIGKDKGPIRVLLWLQPMLWPVCAMLGWAVVRRRPGVRQLGVVVALGVITLSLGDASRLKLIFAPVMVAVGAATCVAIWPLEDQLRLLRTRGRRLAMVLLGVLVFAQVMGVMRRSGTAEGVTDAMTDGREATVFFSYLAQGTSAMGPVLAYSMPEPTGGHLTFPFGSRLASRVGLIEEPVTKADVLDMEAFRVIDPRIAWGGISSLGVLAADFGVEAVGWANGVLMFMTQLLFGLFIYRGTTGHVLATQCCLVAIVSCLDTWLFEPTMVLAIVWAWIFSALVRRRVRGPHRRLLPTGPPTPLQRLSPAPEAAGRGDVVGG